MASTQKFSMDLGLSATPDTTDPNVLPEAIRIYNAIRILAHSIDSYTGALQQDSELWSVLTPVDTLRSFGSNRLYLPYSETVDLGEIITLWDDAGTLTAKKAGGNPWAGDARGYCSIVGGVTAGDFGEVILFGLHPYVTGATPGDTYYLSNVTAGIITAAKPSADTDKLQPIAYALADTILFFCPSILVPTIDSSSLAIAVLTP